MSLVSRSLALAVATVAVATVAVGCAASPEKTSTAPSSAAPVGTSAGAPATAAPASKPTPQPAPSSSVGGWIEGIPSDVPVFGYGKLAESASDPRKDGTLYGLRFEGVRRKEADAYVDALTSAGFAVSPLPGQGGTTAWPIAVIAEKDSEAVDFFFWRNGRAVLNIAAP